jgi:cbb3-type cytochrome oxidase maturation protein
VSAVYFLVPLAVALGGTFAALFLYAASRGQFDDLDDPPWKILGD